MLCLEINDKVFIIMFKIMMRVSARLLFHSNSLVLLDINVDCLRWRSQFIGEGMRAIRV